MERGLTHEMVVLDEVHDHTNEGDSFPSIVSHSVAEQDV
jgi:hypothetical protein